MSEENDEKSAPVPRLRFPGFLEAGEWGEVALGEIAEIKLGKMLDSKKHTTGTLLPYLNNLAVRWNDFDTSNLPKMYFDDDELDRFGLRTGDVVVCEGGEPGRSAVWDGRLPDLKFQKAVHRVRFNVPFEPRLLVLYLESKAGTPQLENLFTGGGIKHLTQEVFARLKIPFTCHAEQQRISGCLASLDDLIATQSQKIEALKTYKKGLMQQLFPREGEIVPRLRFPEFREAGEWKNQPFDKFVVDSFYGTSSPTSENGQYQVLRMGNMFDGRLDFSKLVYIDLDPDSFAKIRLNRGDILLNRTNSRDLVGKISMFDQDIDCITASYIVTYRLDREQIVPTFCNFMLNTPKYQAKIKALARPSVSQANINPTTFRNEVVVSVPMIDEQQRIADCLSSLDDLITAQNQNIDALKTHKKGLMQQLFPVLDEVSA